MLSTDELDHQRSAAGLERPQNGDRFPETCVFRLDGKAAVGTEQQNFSAPNWKWCGVDQGLVLVCEKDRSAAAAMRGHASNMFVTN